MAGDVHCRLWQQLEPSARGVAVFPRAVPAWVLDAGGSEPCDAELLMSELGVTLPQDSDDVNDIRILLTHAL